MSIYSLDKDCPLEHLETEVVCLGEKQKILDLLKINKKVSKVFSIALGHEKVFVPNHIKKLNIEKNELCGINDLDLEPNSNLMELNINNNNLASLVIVERDIDNFHKLEVLCASHNKLNNVLLQIDSLSTLKLDKNNITDTHFNLKCKNLRKLNLNSNKLTEKFIDELNTSSFLELVHLDLSSNNISGIIDLSYLKNLKSLNISCNKITHIKLPSTIEYLYCSSNLFENLDLSNYKFMKVVYCCMSNLEKVTVNLDCTVKKLDKTKISICDK